MRTYQSTTGHCKDMHVRLCISEKVHHQLNINKYWLMCHIIFTGSDVLLSDISWLK